MVLATSRLFFMTLAVVMCGTHVQVHAGEHMDVVLKRGRLKVAVYNNFPPYSDAGKGIDVELGQALAEKLGLKAEIIGFLAGEDMSDDLRNMVWKGHYLRGEPADVMMRVPVDPRFAERNDKARIFSPYQQEVMGMARLAARVPASTGSAAIALEVFTREKIGVETDSLADSFLVGVLNGRLRSNVVHFRSVREAVKALGEDNLSAIMAPIGELQSALGGDTRFVVEEVKLAELSPKSWSVGMAVKAESEDLAAALASALSELQREGAVAAIFQRHGVTLQTR